MKRSAWDVVKQVISESDIIIEVIDARFIGETRNVDLENYVRRTKKRLLFVLNKSDLLDKPFKDVGFDEKPVIFVAATKNLGTTRLRNFLRSLKKKEKLTVGVVGYPNTGKSSLINVLKQRHSAPTSPMAGYTRGMQKIKIGPGLYVIDTPGVLDPSDHDKIKHAMTSVISVSQVRDPDLIAMEVIYLLRKEKPGALESFYGITVEENEDMEVILEKIAVHFHFLKKGGLPDIMRAARKLIEDWQQSRIKIKGEGGYQNWKRSNM